MMKKALISITYVALLAGCTSADVLRHPGEVAKTSKYAPQNERKTENNIGVMRYLNEGASFVREARREDAYKKMFTMCEGKYDIIAETDSETTPITYTSETNTGFVSQTVSSSYRYIHFKCV
ncbi:hypothetical protein [Flocculibacter collagenilyticus]|uniref:hypothetical protein n=1 Tax=Flocculibacter collagenilyticus TaxID=2744479 RepID=UPI0018F6F49E|nr:hypothetical protein [Flocculibacter collagenilyticus]